MKMNNSRKSELNLPIDYVHTQVGKKTCKMIHEQIMRKLITSWCLNKKIFW